MTNPDNDMEMSPSWSRAHDWKSCNRQKRFESSNLSISATEKPAEMRVFPLFMRVFSIFSFCKSCCLLRSFCMWATQKLHSKIPPPVTEGASLYHTFSDTPSASYKRCFCFVLAPGTAPPQYFFFTQILSFF